MPEASLFRPLMLAGACLFLAGDDPPLPQAQGLPPPPPPTEDSAPPPAAPPASNYVPPPDESSPPLPPTPATNGLSPAQWVPPPAPAAQPPAPAPSSAAPSAVRDDSSSSDTATAFDNVNLVNADLADELNITRVGSRRTDDNLLTVFVGLKNKTGHELKIDVQTVYKDHAGQLLSGGEDSWIPFSLKPNEETEYRSVAITADATDFNVRIRYSVPPTPATPAGGAGN